MERSDRLEVSVSPRGPGASGRLDWRRLLSIREPDAALAEIARALSPDAPGDWTLHFSPDSSASGSPVPGHPPWVLVSRAEPGQAGLVDRAAETLGIWRATLERLGEASSHLAARTDELDVLQELGRETSDARTLQGLFRSVAEVLLARPGIDLLLFTHLGIHGEVVATAFPGRPFDGKDLRSLARAAVARLRGVADQAPRVSVEFTDAFDEARRRRPPREEGDALHLPLVRRGGAPACLTIVPGSAFDASQRRLFYGVANQLSLNVDRILSVQEAERGRFRATLDSMPQAVFLTDRDLRVLQTNTAAAERRGSLGLPAVAGGRLASIGSLDLRPLAEKALAGHSSPVDSEAHTGDQRIYSVTVSTLGADIQGEEALVVVVADVTERVRLQQKLAQSEKLSSLGKMISGVAHELNNPLASILGFSQLVRATATEDKMAKRLEVLEKQARRCQRIVKNLLSFARGRGPERGLLSLNEVVDSVVALMSYQLRVDDVQLVAELERSLPSLVGDSHQLQQVLVNLVSNAHQAIRDAGEPGSVCIRTSVGSEGYVRLEVTDDGPGVPEEIRSRIFDPFFTTKDIGKGTGLGLSLVYGIVDSHAGRVEVGAADGGGARFTIDLPVGACGTTRGGAARPESPPGPQPPGSILVVEDEGAVAELICDALGGDGHRVDAVANGREALDRLERRHFDLVISDLKMPVMGGRRLYEEIARRRPELCSRILLTTGDTVSGEPETLAREAGIDLLHKPFGIDELRAAVRSRLAHEDG